MPQPKLIIVTFCAGALLGIAGVLFWISWNGLPARTASIYNPSALTANAQAYVLPVAQAGYSPIRDFNIPDPTVDARAALLADKESGRILYALNPDQELPIASIAKLMSALVILNTLNLDDTYTVSAEDRNVDGLGADLYQNEAIRGSELFKLMLIKSSNDAASVFASAAAKKNIDFVGEMNARAQDLGMTHTYFNDPAGLDDLSTYSTADDLLKLVREVDTYPIIWQTLLMPEADIVSADGSIQHHIVNTDKLLGIIPDVRGGKTGNTTGALGTLILVAGIQGTPHALVGIVLGSHDRFGETQSLIDWGKLAHKWTP